MSLESVRVFFVEHAPELEAFQFDVSLATVEDAALALGVEAGQIAKSLALQIDGRTVILVMRGDARLDNRKFKQRFGVKPRMLDPAEVEAATGHPVGGVCPFGLKQDLQIFCDVSLQAYPVVFPSGGAANAGVRIEPHRLATLTDADWVDVAQAAVEPV